LGIPLTQGGTTKIELIADSANAFAAGDLNKYFKVTLNTSGTSNLKIVENDDDRVVTDITPSVVTSDKIQVVDSAASVVALTLSTPFNAVVGSENVVAGDFQIRTTNAGSVAVQSIVFSGNTNFTSTLISQLKLWRQVGSTWQEIDAQAGFDISSSLVTFDNFDEIVIPASSTQNFRLTLDLVNGSSTGTIAALSVNSVSMQDGENNDITASNTFPVGLVRAITVTTAGSLSVTVDNTDANTNQSKSVVAGNTSDYVASYEFVANNEDVLIKDMTLTASGGSGVSMTNLSSIIKSVQVYEIGTNGATLLAEENTVNSLGYIEFNDFNKVIPQGTKNLYFKVVTQKYGQNFPGIDYLTGISFSLDIATTDAQGVSSNADISTAIDTDDSLAMFVFPIRVSDISFVTSYGSRSVTTPTSPGSGLNLAIIKVTADNWSNTDSSDGSLLSMLINKIKVKNSSSYVSNLTMERIDISNGTVLTASGVGTTAIFHLTSGSTTDRQVGPSDVAYYLVKGDIGGIAAGSNATVRIDLENLDSGSFEFTHDGTSAGTYTALRLGFTKRDGIPVTVNN